MNNIVVLDIDGVLADFEASFCEEFGYNNRHLVPLEKRYPEVPEELIQAFVWSPRTYERLDIINVGHDILRWCDENDLKIHFVSSRPDWLYAVTEEWLESNGYADFYEQLTIGLSDKVGYIVKLNPLFVVEDMLDTVLTLSKVSIPSFLIDWPWNYQPKLPRNVYRVRRYGHFLEQANLLVAKDSCTSIIR